MTKACGKITANKLSAVAAVAWNLGPARRVLTNPPWEIPGNREPPRLIRGTPSPPAKLLERCWLNLEAASSWGHNKLQRPTPLYSGGALLLSVFAPFSSSASASLAFEDLGVDVRQVAGLSARPVKGPPSMISDLPGRHRGLAPALRISDPGLWRPSSGPGRPWHPVPGISGVGVEPPLPAISRYATARCRCAVTG